MSYTHVYPLDDFKEHKINDGPACWCKPRVEDGVIFHNALDQRELIETGQRQIQ